VELFLNGKSLGEKKFSDTKDLHLEWNVPYAAGTIKAIAKKNGKKVCTDEVQTAGAPARIVLTPDHTEINADRDDLSNIKVEIVDKDGRICPNADNLLKFNIEGKGLIAGVGNGNPASHEYFKTNERKAFHGLCLAVIQSKRERGTIHLSAESEGLQPAEVLIQAK
jgi:beta-galactosidase